MFLDLWQKFLSTPAASATFGVVERNFLLKQLEPVSYAVASAGLLAFLFAFATDKFLVLFVFAGAAWLLALRVLGARWTSGGASVPGQRRMFRGVAVVLALLLFVPILYLITALDPSLR